MYNHLKDYLIVVNSKMATEKKIRKLSELISDKGIKMAILFLSFCNLKPALVANMSKEFSTKLNSFCLF